MGEVIYHLVDSIISIAAGIYLILKNELLLEKLGKSDSKVFSIAIKIIGAVTFIRGIITLINFIVTLS